MPTDTSAADMPSWDSTRQLIDLHPTDDDGRRWQLHLGTRNSGGMGSLFGGAGLAAGLECLSAHTGRPAVWGTAQFISITKQPVTIDLEVEVLAAGRKVSQGRVTAKIQDREVFNVMGAVGSRPDLGSAIAPSMPDVQQPEACELMVREDGPSVDAMHQFVEVRPAQGMFGFTSFGEPSGTERTLMWCRMINCELDAAGLAILADYMPSALGNAYGRQTHCSSLDNTIRLCHDVSPASAEDGWVLLENRMEYAANGFAVGSCLMWDRTGTLLATASQSMAVMGFA